MAKTFANKVAIVTGSTAGIGLAIARRLGMDGAKVIVSSRKKDNVDKAVATLRTEGIQVEGTVAHVGLAADRASLVDFAIGKFGRLDILVNNVAINPHFGDLLDVSEKTWDKLFDVNVKAPFLLSKLCVEKMQKTGGGNIVFVSSVAGYQPFQGIAAYSITKTTLLGLVKSLAVSCASHKIRVNCIAPGIIKTDFSKALTDSGDSMMKDLIPLRRYGEAEDCSGAVAFLCDDKSAAYITGETIVIAGGLGARL